MIMVEYEDDEYDVMNQGWYDENYKLVMRMLRTRDGMMSIMSQ